MATGDRKDPYRGYDFRLEIDGLVRAGFRECTGLDEKDSSVAEIKVPGSHKVGDVTLKRGVIGDLSLLERLKETAAGKAQRRNGSIILMDERHEEKMRWNFVGGWPTKWTGPSFNAAADDMAIETLEIVHKGLTKV